MATSKQLYGCNAGIKRSTTMTTTTTTTTARPTPSFSLAKEEDLGIATVNVLKSMSPHAVNSFDTYALRRQKQQQQQQQQHANNANNLSINRNISCTCIYRQQQQQKQLQQRQYAVCTCGTSYHQQAQELYEHQQNETLHSHHYHAEQSTQHYHPNSNVILPTSSQHKALELDAYYGYDFGTQVTDEEDSAFPGLHDREFVILHRNIPALRRTGVNTTAIRQYFYPDGGWGWIICGVSFLVHILTTGLQLSYGLLMFYAIQHLPDTNNIEWLGALNLSISMVFSPFVVAFCRKKSTRLLAVVGGLVQALGVLFTSFATELGQIVFSYGILFAIGLAMVRESSTIMLGNYFKRRRKFVEMVAMSGEGVGIALFSVILKEGVGKAGWRFGLQIVASLVAICFFMGMFYRPASLYHPQRRAIQHLKNQRKKMREHKLSANSTATPAAKYFTIDIAPLKSATVRILLITSAVGAFGIYTPIFLISLSAAKEGSDIQDLVLLQTFLGISNALGVALSYALLRRPFHIRRCLINTKVVAQIFTTAIAGAILHLSFAKEYTTLCILAWIYGMGLGGFRYALKILALERVKLKQFSKAWGLMHAAESIPILLSVPLTSFLNDYSLKYGRGGYYICSAAATIAGIIIFFINVNITNNAVGAVHKNMENGRLKKYRVSTHRCCLTDSALNTDFIYDGCDYAPSLREICNRSCLSLNQIDNKHSHHMSPYCSDSYCISHRADHNADLRCPAAVRRATAYSYSKNNRDNNLQRSLSFIQKPHCCDGQWTHNDNDMCQLSCVIPKFNIAASLVCTCPRNNSLQDSSRSRSVPEGLSTMDNQCTSRSLPIREIIYLPQAVSKQKITKELLPTTVPRCPRQRSQSLSKPLHFVEQITTSV